MRERDIERHLRQAVREAGGKAYKFKSPGQRSVPDRMCVFPGGRVVFVECKAPGEQPTKAQERELESLRALGFAVRVVDSLTDIQDLKRRLFDEST